MNDPTTIRRLYGRRQGHALRAGQAALVEELLPRIAVPADGPLDALRLFGDERALQVEIGFGAGEQELRGDGGLTRARSAFQQKHAPSLKSSAQHIV